MRTLRDSLARLLRWRVPRRYSGRLDRWDLEEQQTIIANHFRSEM